MLNLCPSEIWWASIDHQQKEIIMSYRQRLALAVYSAAKKNSESYPYGIDAYVSALISLEE